MFSKSVLTLASALSFGSLANANTIEVFCSGIDAQGRYYQASVETLTPQRSAPTLKVEVIAPISFDGETRWDREVHMSAQAQIANDDGETTFAAIVDHTPVDGPKTEVALSLPNASFGQGPAVAQPILANLKAKVTAGWTGAIESYDVGVTCLVRPNVGAL